MTPDSLATEVLRFRMGEGVLVRRRGLALLVGAGDQDIIAGLVTELRSVARSRQPGRRLTEAVARMLEGSEHAPALCAVGAVQGGAAVLVHGAAALTVHTDDGVVSVRGGRGTLVRRQVTGRVSAVQAALGHAAEAGPLSPDRWCEIDSGVVRADAFRIGEEPAAAGQPPTAGEPPISGEPLAAGQPPTAGDPAPGEPAAVLSGVCCRAGHFNDPALPYCGVCGIGLIQAGRVAARRKRPALGVLVLDDGRVLPLDRDHVLGRSPDCPEARAGTVTFVPLDDPLVSDVHARISLDGWEVSIRDADSSRGTYVLEPDTRLWQQLRGGLRRPLRPGTVIAVGGRQLRFDTYRVH